MYILYPFLTHTAQTYNMLKETAFLTIYKLQYAMEEKIMHFNPKDVQASNSHSLGGVITPLTPPPLDVPGCHCRKCLNCFVKFPV